MDKLKLFGIPAGLILAIGGWVVTAYSNQNAKIEESRQLVSNHAVKLGVLEEKTTNIDSRLMRIEDKLDRILNNIPIKK